MRALFITKIGEEPGIPARWWGDIPLPSCVNPLLPALRVGRTSRQLRPSSLSSLWPRSAAFPRPRALELFAHLIVASPRPSIFQLDSTLAETRTARMVGAGSDDVPARERDRRRVIRARGSCRPAPGCSSVDLAFHPSFHLQLLRILDSSAVPRWARSSRTCRDFTWKRLPSLGTLPRGAVDEVV